MGQEVRCTMTAGRTRDAGTALLESTEILFRGTTRRRIPFATLSAVEVRDGTLRLTTPDGVVSLTLGAKAAGWADRIRNPKPVIDKLGVRPGQSLVVIGVTDAGFLAGARARADVSTRLRAGADLVFLGVSTVAALGRLAAARAAIAPAGGIWVVWAKGQPHLKEDHVRAAGRAAGLVDVKVVAFSATHSALKLVIPVSARPEKAPAGKAQSTVRPRRKR